ncbi:HAD-IA family hydrolase [Phenylobacterium sp. SCN 70-31]|uniref:HAD-IA family hydrolase n=1 Tax=Phenylobacterium sp. SCN 70-31 TaxID=1660129 RepID=UPI000868EBCD|nr:HAD-IA family hydrolase [Phenylobacterium sp. SCN 70-31]ODT89203.1 MAG: haloacid dehalogenase [Phenylobacterium sp. SCN 70-31]
MALKALMVDVDGVIVTTRPGGWAVDMETDLGLPIATLQAHFFGPHWDDVVMGRADLHDRLAPVLAEHAPHLTSQALADYWFAKDARLDDGLLADLAALRAGGLRLHLATVQEHRRAAYLWDVLGFRDRFDAMHYAADLGFGKPDPRFFAAVEARTGYAPPDLMLLDDRAANVEAARAAGWGGALWDGTEPLDAVLRRAGAVIASAASASPP